MQIREQARSVLHTSPSHAARIQMQRMTQSSSQTPATPSLHCLYSNSYFLRHVQIADIEPGNGNARRRANAQRRKRWKLVTPPILDKRMLPCVWVRMARTRRDQPFLVALLAVASTLASEYSLPGSAPSPMYTLPAVRQRSWCASPLQVDRHVRARRT